MTCGQAQHTLELSRRGRGDFAADGLFVPVHQPSDCRPYSWLAPPSPWLLCSLYSERGVITRYGHGFFAALLRMTMGGGARR